MIPALLSLATLCLSAYLFARWFTLPDDRRILKFTRGR